MDLLDKRISFEHLDETVRRLSVRLQLSPIALDRGTGMGIVLQSVIGRRLEFQQHRHADNAHCVINAAILRPALSSLPLSALPRPENIVNKSIIDSNTQCDCRDRSEVRITVILR